MTTYLLHGFSKQDREMKVRILVDSDNDVTDSPFAKAEKIAGDTFGFITCHNLDVTVPDDCKGIIFNGNEELYARVPQLAPLPPRRRRTRTR